MIPPGLPKDEDARLAALRALRQLDSEPDPELDAVVRVAAQLAGTPIALVSLVDAHRQWFKARVGLDAAETSRDMSFCGHAVVDRDTLIVEDARADTRFADNPLVTGDPHIAFYAGSPLYDDTGEHALGTLCVIDRVPRSLSPAALRALADLAGVAGRLLGRRLDDARRAEAETARDRLAAIVESTDDGVLAITPDGRVTFANAGAGALLGVAPDEPISRPVGEVLATASDELLIALQGALSDATGRRVVSNVRRSDGSTFVAALKPAPIVLSGEVVGASIHFRDISARQREADERDRLAAVLELTPDAVAMMSPDGKPFYANRAMRDWVGYEDGMPEDWTAVHPPWAVKRLREEAIPAVLRRGTWSGETAYLTASGAELPALQVLVASTDEKGRLTHIASVAHDIRERKELERMKDEFLSTVSHELRTPLTSIRGALGLLDDGAVPIGSDKRGELLRIARNNAERLVRMVNDLLDFEKIAAGKLSLRLETTDLRTVARAVLDDLTPFAAERGVTLSQPPDDAVGTVLVDRDRISQVLLNLVSNAIKFSPKGETVAVAVEARDGALHCEVRDRGEGVPESFRARLFDRFAQADGSARRRQQGSGLGLSIARGLVELHGGTIGYAPAPGGGSVFTFSLPARDPQNAPRPTSPASPKVLVVEEDARAALPEQRTQRVLHVEDDADIARVLEAAIGGDVAFRRAGTLREARAALAQERFDLVLLDLSLPDGDGGELLPELRAGPHGAPAIVLLSAREDARELAHEVDAALVKSRVDEGAVTRAIKAALERRAKS